MVRQKQPRPLYRLCHVRFSEYLGNKVVRAGYDGANNQTLSAVRLKLRPFFVEHIPVLVRTSLLQETGEFLFQKSLASGVDCDYGRSILYLLYLLLSKEVKQLKVTLCCYYGCRDMEGVLRCIKKNGSSLEHLELSRTSLLRMDPLLFRNVLTTASSLSTLVVKNVCSDAMLKLIGSHCPKLQYLDISNSKQVSDTGIESLCCEVQIRDKFEEDNKEATFRPVDAQWPPSSSRMVTVQEDFGDSSRSSMGCSGGMPWWRDLRQRVSRCIANGGSGSNVREEILVEVKQVLHPVCSTLKVFDIADTSVTNFGLITILRKMPQLQSLGEFSISDNFLRGLCVVTSLKIDNFSLLSMHARKITNIGIYNMVHVFPNVRAFTCWEPQFDITDMSYFNHLRHLTLLRIPFTEHIWHQILRYVETKSSKTDARSIFHSSQLEKICLEFVMQDEIVGFNHAGPNQAAEFNLERIFTHCKGLKVFMVEFKDGLMMTPPVGYTGSTTNIKTTSLATLVHVQLGQFVQNNAVSVVLKFCLHLKHLHCNRCHELQDVDLAACITKSANRALECFYIYEAPALTFNAFQLLIDGFPNLRRFGNLTRWAVNCEGIQQIVRRIRDNNIDVEILCGSHWFSSQCDKDVSLPLM